MEPKERVAIPMWLLTVLKMAVPAVIAIGTMYIRMAAVEKDVGENDRRISRLEATVEARGEMIRANKTDIGIIQTKQSIMEKAITDSLTRIESDVKEVKRDVRELQQRK